MNILIVDDCPLMRKQLSSLFSKHPTVHKVASASSFVEAVNQCNRLHFHVVLIDYDLKDSLNGVDVCRWIRKRNPECIIIFVSGFPTTKIMEEAYAAGTNDFITKPMPLSEVRIKVFHWWQVMKCPQKKPADLTYHGLKYVFKTHDFLANGRVVPLTKGMKRLLRLFLEKPETVISHDSLQRELWGDHDTALKPRNLHERIGALRAALPTRYSRWLRSVRGEGYKLSKNN